MEVHSSRERQIRFNKHRKSLSIYINRAELTIFFPPASGWAQEIQWSNGEKIPYVIVTIICCDLLGHEKELLLLGTTQKFTSFSRLICISNDLPACQEMRGQAGLEFNLG